MSKLPTLRRRYAVAIAAYCAFIFILSAQSKPPQPEFALKIPGIDKIAHAVLYGGLAGLISVGLRQSNGEVDRVIHFYGPIVFAVCYGMTDEVHQLFVPKRTFDLWDLTADAVGACAMQIGLCGVLWKKWPHGRPSDAVSQDT